MSEIISGGARRRPSLAANPTAVTSARRRASPPSASAIHGRFTVTGKLALLLAEQRTPRTKDGRGWNTRALRADNVARALAEIDALMFRAEFGDEPAKERIRQLRVEAGYMRRVEQRR